MNLFVLFSLINGITATLFGVFVFLKNRKDLLNKTFFLMSLGVAIWSFGYCKWLLVEEREIALFWSRALNFGATLIPIFYLHWVLGLLNLAEKKKQPLIAGYLMTFIFLCFSFTPYYIKSVKPILSFPHWPQAGPLYICFLFLGYLGLVGYGFYQLFKNRKTAPRERRAQIDYVILGTILGFGGGATNFPLMFGVSLLPPIGQPLVALYVLFLALAVLRYHLFEIKVILTELLVGIMGVVLVVLPFLMPTPNLKILTLAVFLLFLIFGYYLVNATHKEEGRREEAERMAVQERALRLRTERLTRARDQFILSSQHYFRTPLTSIIGFLEMVLDESYGKLPEKVKEKLGLTSRSVLELRKRIEESLDISQFQIRKGKGILSLEEVRVEDLIKNVIEELKPQAKEKNLYLEVSFPENPLPKMKLDKKRMFMVFVNLIDNGIKHTLKGGIKLFLEYLKDKNSILFSVKDTGIGIPKEELPFIGQMPFERGRKAKELTPLGKGIGLYLSRLVVEAHGGKLWAESEGIGKGSVFYIELPVK